MSLLQQESDDACKQEIGDLKSFIFNTHFFSKLFDEGNTNLFTYDNVKRWPKNIDIFSCNKLYFPINIKNTHWTLAVVSMKTKSIDYYDSYGGDGQHWVDGLMDYISLKWNDIHQFDPFLRHE